MKKIWHPWTEWECYKAGFFETTHPDKENALNRYAGFLSDIPRFRRAMERVSLEWPKSCEHWLTNESMNRIAWLGQSAMCIETGIPACFRGGFKLLTDEQQRLANKAAQEHLNAWIENHRANQSIHHNLEKEGLSRGFARGSARPLDESRFSAFIQGDLFGPIAQRYEPAIFGLHAA